MRAFLWIALAVGLGLAARGLRPPAPRAADAPGAEFSAERAFPAIAALAAAPRARPATHHEKSRSFLAGRLRALGFEPQEQAAVVDGLPVRNLLARRAGSGAQSGAVLLCAHYDSVAAGQGAGDDALGCAVLLELLRALGEAPPPARDLIALFTDGEEIALLGARAFLLGGDAASPPHPWAQDVALALNFEARGSGGPAWMFQTSAGNLDMVRALAGAPAPAGSSLAKAVYDRMPNDTDLTVFLRAGVPGMNWACVDRFASYHTKLDVPERLDRGTLQQMGDQGLTIARWALDWRGAFDAGKDAAYFTILGGVFVHHPLRWTRALALVPALAFLAWSRVRRRRPGAVALGFLPVAGALLIAAAVILLAQAAAPGAFSMEASHASDDHLRALGLSAALAAAVAALLVQDWARRRWPRADGDAASLLLAGAGAVTLSFALPEGAFLLLVPATCVPLALLVPGSGAAAWLARGAAVVLVASLIGTWVYSLIIALALPAVLVPSLLAAFTVLVLRPLWTASPAAAPSA